MSTNAQLAATLNRMADLLLLTGADSFRAAAHARAARAVESLTADIASLVRDAGDQARQRVMAIEGIGPKLADKILEFVRTGRIAEAEALAAEVPPGLPRLLALPNLGPKTLRVLWQQGGITDAESLRRAIADGTLRRLPRMGDKAVARIAASLELLDQSSQRLPLGLADAVARRVIAHLSARPGITRAEAAGSLRRGRDTVGDIDILLACDRPEDSDAAHAAFRSMPGVSRLLSAGATRSSVRLTIDPVGAGSPAPAPDSPSVQVDLRTIEPRRFGAALAYFTGSKEHNIALRQRALDRGLTLSEYGLFPNDHDPVPPHQRGVTPVAAATEQEIYAALDLPWIPPERREGSTLPDSPAPLPRLIELSDLRAELHAHTTASDGVLSIVDLARTARGLGLHTIAVTDHSRSSTIAHGLDPARLRAHVRAVHAARAEVPGITILAGSEVDILADGTLDYDDELLALLDLVIASPHAALSQGPEEATRRLLRAVEHPRVHILGHPTGRLILQRRGLEPDTAALFAAAAARGVALEINAHWMRLDLRDTHAEEALRAGCLLAINADVHHPDDFDNRRFGVTTARRAGLTPDRCLNAWPAERLHEWLASR